MAKYDVTPELASLIKSIRIRENVTAKAVSEHIKKSQSYFSKLEKAEIKTIEQDELIDIFHFILGSEEAFQNFLNSSLFDIIVASDLRFSDEEIANKIWYYNFDQVLRMIPIPESLVDYLANELEQNNISISYLCDRINGNEAIATSVENLDNYSYNTWHMVVEDGKVENIFIKMKVDFSEIEGIMLKKLESTNYITLRSMVFYINVIKKYGDNKNLSRSEYNEITSETINLLNSHKFYSLEEKHYLEQTAKSDAERDSLLSEFDRKNAETINGIINIFKLCSDVDTLKTTKYLNCFKKNLDWDGGFILKLISCDFYDINNVTREEKQQLLNEIYELITKYQNKPTNDKTVEFYE